MKRNKFSLSHHKLMSMDMGLLVPMTWFEVLPGDTIQQATSALVRAAPLVSPVMHPVDVRIHHWFVPYRIIWEDWEDFITGGPDGMDASEFPTRSVNGSVGGLTDYLGVPTGAAFTVNVLPYRAYQLIWNEWYRDQDLQTEAAISLASGVDGTTATGLQRINWEKDYLTSARPWEQKGPAITIPIGSTAPVKTDAADLVTGAQERMHVRLSTTGNVPAVTNQIGHVNGGVMSNNAVPGAVADGLYPSNLYADLSGASAVTVTALREAMALQRFEEARARYGSRYVEYLRYLGVRSSDARLQRPEYLGGGRQVIQFSEVLQTGDGDGSVANTVGSLKGHGIGAMRSNRYRRFFEEHGVVMSMISVRPKTIYMNRLERKFNRRVKEDFWQRELEHIGQQEVLNKEVYASHTTPDGVFGYQDRYDEYRRCESTVAGEFRTTLNYWHFARAFTSDPALNSTFVACTPTEVPFADSTSAVLYVMANHSIQARRMVAKTGKSFIF